MRPLHHLVVDAVNRPTPRSRQQSCRSLPKEKNLYFFVFSKYTVLYHQYLNNKNGPFSSKDRFFALREFQPFWFF